MALEDVLEPQEGLVPLLLWVRLDCVADAMEACAPFARLKIRAWTTEAMASLMDEIGINAERALRALASEESANRWVRSSQVAAELGIDSASLAGAVRQIRSQAEAMQLASPVTFALRRKDGGVPLRHIKLAADLAELVRQADATRRGGKSEDETKPLTKKNVAVSPTGFGPSAKSSGRAL